MGRSNTDREAVDAGHSGFEPHFDPLCGLPEAGGCASQPCSDPGQRWGKGFICCYLSRVTHRHSMHQVSSSPKESSTGNRSVYAVFTCRFVRQLSCLLFIHPAWPVATDLGKHPDLWSSSVNNSNARDMQNPAFGPTQIRELTEIFVQKSAEVHRDAIYTPALILSASVKAPRRLGRRHLEGRWTGAPQCARRAQ